MLKLSGEAFLGTRQAGIDPERTRQVAQEVLAVHALGVDIAVTVGGGNIFRGTSAAEHGMDRATGDDLGMLATVMNALALHNAIEKLGGHAHVLSAIHLEHIAEPYARRQALKYLKEKHLVIFAAGTGNPFFTTDMAAVLRALEMNCDVVLKGSNVNGVYTKDPREYPDAKKLTSLKLLEAVENPNITIFDNSALALCADHALPVVIFDITKPGELDAVVHGMPVGTTIH
jgi:uridylate kinase